MQRRLLLNLCPVEFDEGTANVTLTPFESSDQLRTLRKAYAGTHLVRRQGPDLQVVALRDDATPVDGQGAHLSLARNLSLVAALVRESLVSYLHGIGREVAKYHPILFIAGGDRDSLLPSSTMAAGSGCVLDVRPKYELEVRTVNLDNREPFIGIAFNVRSVKKINGSCADWIRCGLDVRGLYVGDEEEQQDPRLAKKFSLLGRVSAVEGDTLVLDDARAGIRTADASSVRLECRYESFRRCLGLVHRGDTARIERDLERQLQIFRSGPGRLDKLSRVVSFLGSRTFPLLPNVDFRIRSFLEEGTSQGFPVVHIAPKPVFVFDASGSRTDTWNDGGLRKHGPFSADVFTPSRPRICVICQTTKKGQVDQFLQKFLYGVRPNAQGKAPFSDGLVRKYALEGVTHEYFLTEGRTAQAYQRAARSALERQQETGSKWDLALIQIDEDFHDLQGEDNPYFVMKAQFLSQQINVQEFEIETVTTTNETQLGYALNNMALATYAKLGGTPWLLRTDRTRAHELVIGIGSASVGDGRLGDRERVVGITTVFSGDGNYYLSSASKSVPIAEYQEALLSTLRASVERAKTSMNWQPRDHVRLIFHSFKPMKDREAEAVKTFMKGLGDYDWDYAFVEIVEDHPYLLFDKEQTGQSAYGGGRPKGALAPTRGWFFRMSSYEVLLCLTGARELKKPEDGMPWPILIRLHRDSTFKDTTYLAKQAFAFSAHSWRSFFPSHLPVTIMYSELVAKHLGKLSRLPRWNPDVMFGRIGETRWFL
jgi:hypothetical protein